MQCPHCHEHDVGKRPPDMPYNEWLDSTLRLCRDFWCLQAHKAGSGIAEACSDPMLEHYDAHIGADGKVYYTEKAYPTATPRETADSGDSGVPATLDDASSLAEDYSELRRVAWDLVESMEYFLVRINEETSPPTYTGVLSPRKGLDDLAKVKAFLGPAAEQRRHQVRGYDWSAAPQ